MIFFSIHLIFYRTAGSHIKMPHFWTCRDLGYANKFIKLKNITTFLHTSICQYTKILENIYKLYMYIWFYLAAIEKIILPIVFAQKQICWIKTIKISRKLRNIRYFQYTEFFLICTQYMYRSTFVTREWFARRVIFPYRKTWHILHLVTRHIFTPGRYLLMYEHKALASLLVHPVR